MEGVSPPRPCRGRKGQGYRTHAPFRYLPYAREENMNLAVVQLRTPLLNVPRARAMLLAAVEQAVKARADLVLLPEL